MTLANGDRVRVLAGPDRGLCGRIQPCDSDISEHKGEWARTGEQGLAQVWVVLDGDERRSADPSGGYWGLVSNLKKVE